MLHSWPHLASALSIARTELPMHCIFLTRAPPFLSARVTCTFNIHHKQKVTVISALSSSWQRWIYWSHLEGQVHLNRVFLRFLFCKKKNGLSMDIPCKIPCLKWSRVRAQLLLCPHKSTCASPFNKPVWLTGVLSERHQRWKVHWLSYADAVSSPLCCACYLTLNTCPSVKQRH